MTPIDQALAYMASEFSVAHKDAFRAFFKAEGDPLLDACLNLGYLKRRGDEVILTPMGHARERATAKPFGESSAT
jgi:hypothetical protein